MTGFSGLRLYAIGTDHYFAGRDLHLLGTRLYLIGRDLYISGRGLYLDFLGKVLGPKIQARSFTSSIDAKIRAQIVWPRSLPRSHLFLPGFFEIKSLSRDLGKRLYLTN